jgi:hypothetical protein
MNKHMEVAEVLVNKGADINIVDHVSPVIIIIRSINELYLCWYFDLLITSADVNFIVNNLKQSNRAVSRRL